METANGNKNGYSANGHRLAFGDFEIDAANRMLWRGGVAVPVTGKVFDILIVLAENPGRLLEKDEFLEKVWHSDFVEEGNLARNISSLRKALGDTGKEHKYIDTIQGRGYRFIADVNELNGNGSTVGADETEELVDLQDQNGPTRRTKKWLWVIFIAILITTAAWLGKEMILSPRDGRIKSIAVIPFVNSGQDANLEYLSDGMTENIINDLSPAAGLKVKSKNSVFRYKGTQLDTQKIAAELDVQSILTGKISQVNDRLIIDVELIDAADNSQIWGQQFISSPSAVISTQSSIVRSVIQNLHLNLTDEQQIALAKAKTTNAEAYRFYLLGRYFWNKRTSSDLKRAVANYNQAVTIDPAYAAAYSGLANSYALYSIYDVAPPNEAFPIAKEAAEHALALDESLAEAHASLAFVLYHYDRDWARAETEFKRAIELDPNYATAHHWYGEYLGAAGRFDEAIAEQNTALQIDPLSFIINMDLGWNFYLDRRYDEAVEQYRKALELEPNSPITHETFSETFAQEGKYEDAAGEYFVSLDANGFSSEQVEPLKRAFEVGGFKDLVRARIAWRQKVQIEKYPPQLIDIAWDYAFLGEKDKAFEWLRKSFEKREADMVFLKFNPGFDSLHNDPRFGELTKQIGMP